MQPVTLGNWKLNPNSGNYEAGYDGDVPIWIPGQPPVLSSFSGTLSDGQTITLTGSNLSSNRQGQLVYDDFSVGTLGQPISGIGSIWTTVSGQPPYVFDSDGLAAGKRSAYCNMDGGPGGTVYDYMTGIIFDDPHQVLYCETWIKYTMDVVGPDNGSGGPQMKMIRFGPGSDSGPIDLLDHSDNPNYTFTMLDVNATGYVGGEISVGQGAASTTYGAGQTIGAAQIYLPPDGQWHKLHMASKVSDFGVANGWRYAKTDATGTNMDTTGDYMAGSWAMGTERHFASPNAVVPKTDWRGEDWTTFANVDGSTQVNNPWYQRILLPYFTRTYQRSTVRIAAFWANDSAERVVISQHSNVNLALKQGITQRNTARAVSQWQFVFDSGNLPASGPLYAHVVNADGEISDTPLQIRS